MPRINQLPSASFVASTDVVAVDTENGTKRVPKSTLFDGYYTAAEADAAIAQSTANTNLNGTVTGYLPVKNSGCAVFSGGNANDAYSVMSQLIPGRCVPFVIANADAASLLTDGKLTSPVKGILSRTGANGQFYDFVGGPGGGYNKMYSWRVIATSASDMSLQAVYEFTGTQI